MMLPMPRILSAVAPFLLLGALVAQEPEPAPKAEPAFGGGWNSAVGLGGGAGGRFGLRGKPLPGDTGVAIKAGLTWLGAHGEGRRWSGADPEDQATALSVTSLVVLAMLGDGSTLRSGPWREPIKTGVAHIRSHQREDGAFLPARSGDVIGHALATTAIGEAYVLSNYKLLQGNVNKALAWLDVGRGADGTFPLVVEGKSDAVATLWGRWARMTGEFGGVVKDDAHLHGIGKWLDSDDADRLLQRSLLSVTVAPGSDLELRHELDAVKLLLDVFVSDKAEAVDAVKVGKVRDRKREWKQGVDLHEWMCAGHLLQQLGTAEDVDKVITPLLSGQRGDGEHAGSWDPIDLCGDTGGRAWTTAMAVLTLQSKQRYAKRFR